MQLNLTAGVIVDLLSHTLVHNRELKLIRLNRCARVVRVIARLNHLSLVGLKHKTLTLEVVDVAFVRAFAIHKEELKKNKNTQADEQYAHYACHYFTTCIHILCLLHF